MVTSVMCHTLMTLGFLIISNLDAIDGAFMCRAGTLEQCHTLPFVPGHDQAGEGYDVVKLEPTGAYVFEVNKYLSPTSSCTICTNPLMDDQFQKLPHYMADWHTHSDRCKSVNQTFSSLTSAVQSASSVIMNNWRLGLELPVKGGGLKGEVQMAGSKSKVQSFSSSSFQSEKTSLNVNQFHCKHYRFRVPNRSPLSVQFQQDIQSLPLENMANTTEAYRSFIEIYGTHYIRLVDLGGRMNKVTTIDTCLATLNTVTVGQVEHCMNMGIMVGQGLVKLAQVAPNMTSEACRKILNNRDTVTNDENGFLKHMTEVVGGNGWSGEFSLTTEDSAGFTKWKDSLKTSPDILSFNLSPLHELVADAKIKSNLRKAIRAAVSNSRPAGVLRPTERSVAAQEILLKIVN